MKPLQESDIRPEVLYGRTFKVKTSCGNCYVTINRLGEGEGGSIVEVFATHGKAGGCQASFLEGMTRVISIALRAGVDVKRIIKTLQGVRCPSPFWGNTYITEHLILSCTEAIARLLQMEVSLGEERK